MSGTSTNYSDWRLEPTLKLYELASILKGIDPRALGDVTDQHGAPLDLSADIASLKTRLDLGELTRFKDDASPRLVEVTMTSVIDFLRRLGHWGIAKQLSVQIHPDDGPIMKKNELIPALRRTWPKIEDDIKRAADNGLADEAAAERSGYWLEGAALRWAKRNGRLKGQDMSNQLIGEALAGRPMK